MKKLLIVLLLVCCTAVTVFAQDVTVLPAQVGVLTLYDYQVRELKLGARYPVLNWKSILFLDGDAITDSIFKDIAFGLGIGAELTALAKLAGLNITLPGNVNLGYLYACAFHTGVKPRPCFGPWIGFTIPL